MKERGFTIVEMLVVVVLIGVCGIVVADLFIGQNRIYKVQMAELTVTGDARGSLDDIDNYVRQANRVLDVYDTYTTGPQILILQIQSIEADNDLIPATFDIVVYHLNGTDLLREVIPNASSARGAMIKKLASNVNSLAFGYNDVSMASVTEVTTDMTIQEDAGIQSRSITISSRSILRNY